MRKLFWHFSKIFVIIKRQKVILQNAIIGMLAELIKYNVKKLFFWCKIYM